MQILKKLLNKFFDIDNYMRTRAMPPVGINKLHLGCGNIHIDGWCNIDARPSEFVDVVDDVTKLAKFPIDSASEIYACHVLEHVSHNEVEAVLKRWLDVLIPGGTIRISVPDLDKIVTVYYKNWNHFQTDGNSPWIGLIYGGQDYEYNYHKTGFNFCWLKHLMNKAGYVDINTYPNSPHFISGVNDASLANEPFGEFLSLNVVANKAK